MSQAGTKSGQGDDYQIAVAMHWVINLLSNDDIDYMQAESNGLPGINESVPVDDIVIVYRNCNRTHIQAKKNQTKERAWSIKDWGSELPKILEQLEQGKHISVELYSATPLGDFKTLIDTSKEYSDFSHFSKDLSANKQKVLDVLAREWIRSEEEVYDLLKRLKCASPLNLEDRIDQNYKDLERIISQVDLALPVLESFINRHQSKSLANKLEIRANDVMEELSKKGLTRMPSLSEEDIIKQFKKISAIGRNDWKRKIAGEKIERKEFNDTLTHIKDKKNTILVLDRPGSGKTCLLLDVADEIESLAEYQLLFIKGDRFAKINSNENALPNEIVEGCGLLSEYSQVVVIIDSLDVLSCQRDHKALNYFLKLIDQLELIPNVTVVAACRDFDLKYAPLLRDRKWESKIELKDFDYNKTVLPILKRLEVDDSQLHSDLKQLLCLPQNLSLFEALTQYEGIFNVRTTYELYDAFIEYTLRRDPDLDDSVFDKIHSLVSKLLKEREHSVSKVSLNIEEELLQKLISKGVLNQEANGKIGFSHQTLLDNFVASHALKNDITLTQLILENPPLPFFRPSVRSYLFFLRGRSCKEFRRSIKETLSDGGIAYHFKRLIIETYAEMIPEDQDWSLVRWMFLKQEDLFKRFFWTLKSEHWFDTIANRWYPSLAHHPNNKEWYSVFLRKLDTWMNVYPKEVVAIWNNALEQDWGKDNIWSICRDLTLFKDYKVNGIAILMEKVSTVESTDDLFKGELYSKYVEASGEGDELLWNWIVRDVKTGDIGQLLDNNELHCEDHCFCDKSFLDRHLKFSDTFLNLALEAIIAWSKQNYTWRDIDLTNAFIGESSWEQTHNSGGIYGVNGLTELLEGVEGALIYHAEVNSSWWQKEESKLRSCKEITLRYFLIKAYSKNPEKNVLGITYQLADTELLGYGDLDYELACLINSTFYLLSDEHQLLCISKILDLYKKEIISESPSGRRYRKRIFDFIVSIPTYLRTIKAQEFIDNHIPLFGYYPPIPRINSWSGGGSSLSVEELNRLSIKELLRLLNHYYNYDERSSHPRDWDSGGKHEIERAITSATLNDPLKYFGFMISQEFEKFKSSFSLAVLDGVSNHLRCRFGNVTDNSYKLSNPLPDENVLVAAILKQIESNASIRDNAIAIVRILENCCAATDNIILIKRIIPLLRELALHSDPQKDELKIHYTNKTGLTERDILTTAMNSVRGIAATSLLHLYNKLFGKGVDFDEEVFVLINSLANDPVVSVRAGLISGLPQLIYNNPEKGWTVFKAMFRDSQTHLWLLGEKILYRQYRHNYTEVKVCLDKIKGEAMEVAGATWGRISALSMLEGHISLDDLFSELVEVKSNNAWSGAIDVFVANVKSDRGHECAKAIELIIRNKYSEKGICSKMGKVFSIKNEERHVSLDMGKLFIESINGKTRSVHLNRYFNWISFQSNLDPFATLELCEQLIERLTTCSIDLHGNRSNSLISALTAILREADESNNSDLINRAVHLQDQFLMMGVNGMDKYLDEATLM